MQTVGIIGGSGFIGSYVTRKFLAENYNVRVSSTDISNKEKYQHLMDLPNGSNLEIFPLDVEDITALRTFAEGCEILVHGGTPFILEVQDPQKELFDPTIKGTENFLQVVHESPTVKKVVFIASIASHNTDFPLPAQGRGADHVYTENDLPFSNETSNPYGLAKYHADQVVRKFVNEHPEISFDIVTVSPVIVVGNAMSARQDSTSMGMQFLIKNKIAPNPFMEFLFEQDTELALVDVDDVAESIYKAATTDGLHGKHYLLSSESWRVSDISLMLNQQSPVGKPRIVISNELAKQDLGVAFKAAQLPLSEFV